MNHLPAEPKPLSEMPLDQQHFKMLCLAVEKAHALHTGKSGRLLMNFELREGSDSGHLPRVRPLGSLTFIVDEAYLKASDFYLYYDPDKSQDLPLLAELDKDNNRFVAATKTLLEHQSSLHGSIAVPVARLSALRGLHYVKDSVCLQMYEIDFDRLFDADAELAGRLRQSLLEKYRRFYDFDAIAERSSQYEEVARRFLEEG
ncbi:hypothetical protein [Pseudoteredinibacter isoporae]|uniref:Uncharacterized protein n=1 Tax=Pseudoteredinibacter isoporae TaxID=570281 RepID=A0A7X0MVM9_9GAMM|nr:hypothetical protein [Pseudoteredinibacter isoporae]MBB6521568.1 hypothetical protein [Pseudoteredinibacter isoporae]NHO87122.1 hypothetical protein [Pseudoteredinibacter isoporae]NIB22946.1 hypothetical protein [Pseudoteredinibacter isoporae]